MDLLEQYLTEKEAPECVLYVPTRSEALINSVINMSADAYAARLNMLTKEQFKELIELVNIEIVKLFPPIDENAAKPALAVNRPSIRSEFERVICGQLVSNHDELFLKTLLLEMMDYNSNTIGLNQFDKKSVLLARKISDMSLEEYQLGLELKSESEFVANMHSIKDMLKSNNIRKINNGNFYNRYNQFIVLLSRNAQENDMIKLRSMLTILLGQNNDSAFYDTLKNHCKALSMINQRFLGYTL